ncbi:unnamed protein product [Knipowitschia caucasica]
MAPAFSLSDSDLDLLVQQRLVPALCSQGFCWLDGVLGDVTGGAVLERVMDMQRSGILRGGQLMRPSPVVKRSAVRGDVTAWCCGEERDCEALKVLLRTMDHLVSETARSLQRTISHRSKAMFACFPGGGAGYVKHVDNPNNDGRCLTCIYYLNKDWSSSVQGGALRMFPEGKSFVVDIEPLFDRLLLFWSDRRNPHQVLPSYAPRFAVTVWYFDSDERAEAKRRSRERSDSENSNSSE